MSVARRFSFFKRLDILDVERRRGHPDMRFRVTYIVQNVGSILTKRGEAGDI